MIFLGLFGVALAGGLHCMGMCGGLASMNRSASDWGLYQIGRLGAYLGLGLLAHEFGSVLLGNQTQLWVQVLLLVAVGVLFGARFSQNSWLRMGGLGSISLGFLTGLLPCHFLWFFVGLAATQPDQEWAAFTMVALWSGSLPWLAVASSLSGLALNRSHFSLFRSAQPLILLMLTFWAVWNVVGRQYVKDGNKTDDLVCVSGNRR